MTPRVDLAYRSSGARDGPEWSIRCVPNRFPALEWKGEPREHQAGLPRRRG